MKEETVKIENLDLLVIFDETAELASVRTKDSNTNIIDLIDFEIVLKIYELTGRAE